MVLIGVIAIGYQSTGTENTPEVANVATVKEESSQAKSSLSTDGVTATSIASTIASSANMSVAPNVSNLAISAQIIEDMPVATIADASVSEAPQVVVDADTVSDVQDHTVVEGENVDTIADKYGISKDTIRWANDLTEDSIAPGKVIKILPTDGISYTVKAEDTVESIAEKYKVSAERLILFNDLELTGVKEGDSIILPSGELPEEERPGYVAPRAAARRGTASTVSTGGAFRSGSVGNRYARGWCTWYAYERRAQVGRPVGSFWGNANTWASAARANGYLVNNIPAPGAIFQTTGGSYYGHVGYVESVDWNSGTVTIADMNGKAGWNRIGRETVSISEAQNKWTFIH